MQPGAHQDAVYIIAETASEIQSKAYGRDHSAEINFETKYGPFQSAVELANITVLAYALGFQDGSCANFTLTSNGDGYVYSNSHIFDPSTGGTFSRAVLDADERGEEYTNRGMALLPDSIVWSQRGPYEWHPYISKVFKASSLRNKFPTFMVRASPFLLCAQPLRSSSLSPQMGPFIDSTFQPTEDHGWRNVLGLFPRCAPLSTAAAPRFAGPLLLLPRFAVPSDSPRSIKLGISQYCSAVLQKSPPSIPGSAFSRKRFYSNNARDDPQMYTKVKFDDIQGSIWRMRKPDGSPVTGTYDSITPDMAMKCQLCHQYGAPLQYSPIDSDCKVEDKHMRCLPAHPAAMPVAHPAQLGPHRKLVRSPLQQLHQRQRPVFSNCHELEPGRVSQHHPQP